MKSTLLILAGLFFAHLLFAQTKVKLKYEAKRIKFDDKSVSFKKGGKFNLQLSGINTAHHMFKIETKHLEISSPSPEVLKPLGLTNNVAFNSNGSVKKDDLNTRMIRLYGVKKLADSIRKSTDTLPNSMKVVKALEKIHIIYDNPSTNEELRQRVVADIAVINADAELTKAIIVNTQRYNEEFLNDYATALTRAEELKQKSYLSYIDYLINSQKAKEFQLSDTFTASKDLTEIRLILIDTYSKDTLYNAVETIYNFNGVGLSFSTGFFHTRFLSDSPYYLEVRPDGNKGINSDMKMKSDISIGGFGHLYWKAKTWLRIGPGLGLSISPFDGKSRYLAGGGLLFGKEKMIGLTFGGAWAKVKQLSRLVSQDASGRYLPADATTVPTFERIKTSWFFGLNYNLVSTRK